MSFSCVDVNLCMIPKANNSYNNILLINSEPSVKIIGNSGDPDYQEMVTGDDLIFACEVSRASATSYVAI